MKRWGLVRIIDDADAIDDLGTDQPYRLAIRPGIVDILGESALRQLAQWAPEENATVDAESRENEDVEAAP